MKSTVSIDGSVLVANFPLCLFVEKLLLVLEFQLLGIVDHDLEAPQVGPGCEHEGTHSHGHALCVCVCQFNRYYG